jgi:hypothetical protein
MKEFYKKPEFYYFIMPVFAIVWILTVASLTLPTAEKKLENAKRDDTLIQGYVATILTNKPERINYKEQVKKTGKFAYEIEIENFAKMHGISSSDYTLTSAEPIRRRKQLTQSADINIKSIDIERFAKFLSSIQQSWPNLQCDSLTLTKHKKALDLWTAKMKFIYIFKK